MNKMIDLVYNNMKVIDTLFKIFFLIIFVPIIVTNVPTGPLHFMAITGTSMEPTITANDIVFVMPSITQPEVGDIISYNYELQSGQIVSVIHRVVKVVKEGYITKGDANPIPDNDVVTPKDVMGIMFFKIPIFGAVVHFARTTTGLLTIVLFPTIILIIQKI